MASAPRWTRDELLVILNVYHKLTFGQMHARQPVIQQLAQRIGRSSNSVAMKLCNMASLDPALRLRGIKGLQGASATDRAVWAEFHQDLPEAAPASEEALRRLFEVPADAKLEVVPGRGIEVSSADPPRSTEALATLKVRRGQEYFRGAVLNNFGGACGVSQLAVRELLVASHILPWSSHANQRLSITNGLCLSRIHDAAFDRGLITFDDVFKLVLSSELRDALPQRMVAENFGAYSGEPLRFPADAVPPDLQFIREHRLRIFRG